MENAIDTKYAPVKQGILILELVFTLKVDLWCARRRDCPSPKKLGKLPRVLACMSEAKGGEIDCLLYLNWQFQIL